MKEKSINTLKSAAFNALAAAGAAPGMAGRARTIPSGKQKANDPRRQRRNWRKDLP
jgi:hypothetical protein